MIDKNTLEIKQDEDKVVYKDLESIGEDLPDHSPRFVLLSYPLTLVYINPIRRDILANAQLYSHLADYPFHTSSYIIFL